MWCREDEPLDDEPQPEAHNARRVQPEEQQSNSTPRLQPNSDTDNRQQKSSDIDNRPQTSSETDNRQQTNSDTDNRQKTSSDTENRPPTISDIDLKAGASDQTKSSITRDNPFRDAILGLGKFIQCVPRKGFASARSAVSGTIYACPSVHKQLCRSFRALFEAHIVDK